MEETKVFELTPILGGKADRYFSERKGYAKRCEHHILVDMEHRKLQCKLCEKIVDPFEYVSDLAFKEIQLFEHLQIHTNENAKLISNIRKLEAQKRNLQQDIDNLKKMKISI